MRGMRAVAIAVAIAMVPVVTTVATSTTPAAAQTSTDLRTELERTSRERLAAERELARIRTEKGDARARYAAATRAYDAAKAELNAILASLAAATDELAASEESLAAAEAAYAEVSAEVAEAEEAYAAKVARFEARLVAAFKYGQVSLVEVVAGSRGIDDLIVSSTYVSNVVDADKKLVLEIEELLSSLQAQRARADALRDEADLERDRAEAAAVALERARSEQARVTADVESSRRVAAEALRELEADEKAITEHLDALARSSAEIERRLRAAEGTDPGDVGSGWVRPTNGYVSSPYGYRVHPIYQTVRLHAGVDLSSPTGTPIRAAKGGNVTFVGWMSGYGQTVIIYHGDGRGTLYAHLSSFSVSQGSTVSQGQVVGAVGMTGTATGPHLHFEVRVNGTPRDPCGYIAC